MKKLFFFFLMMLLPMAGSAHDAIIDGIYYLFDQKAMTATVTYDHFQLFKYSGEVVIPETVAYEGKSYCVAAIGNQAFYNNKELYSVIIPNSVISIGFQAFYGCSELCAINISDSVKDISMEAFESTRWYNSQPDGLVYAGKVAYKFKGTMQATDIVLKEGTTGIAGNAFYNCPIQSITIPSTLKLIGDGAFLNCNQLSSVYITDVAAWCEIEYPSGDNPLIYAHRLFLNGEEVNDLMIPDNVTSIADFAFQNCTNLTAVTIPNSTTSIGKEAFLGCSNLISVLGGNSLTSIEANAFMYCENLSTVHISSFATHIGDRAFYGCKSLVTIEMPNTVTSIGSHAFDGCAALSSITIPEGLTAIESCAFAKCTGLINISIPSNVSLIRSRAFWGCSSLTSIEIGSGVKSIDDYSFSDCADLKEVFCYAKKVPSTSYEAFNNSPITSATLHIPVSSMDAYKAKEPWSGFKYFVSLPEQCATPTIAYVDGRLTLSTDTEDAECVWMLKMVGQVQGCGNIIVVPCQYELTVYATKEGWQDSDRVTFLLVWGDGDVEGDNVIRLGGIGSGNCDVNGDGTVDVADIATIISEMAGKARMQKIEGQ